MEYTESIFRHEMLYAYNRAEMQPRLMGFETIPVAQFAQTSQRLEE